jgi:hypothetical protein
MLKAKFQPGKHARSWNLSIEEHRIRIHDALEESPSVQPHLPQLVARAYRTARLRAAETGLDLEIFPESCPVTLPEITNG